MNKEYKGFSKIEVEGNVEEIMNFYSNSSLYFDITININNYNEYENHKNIFNFRFKIDENFHYYNNLKEIEKNDFIKIKLLIEYIGYQIENHNIKSEYILKSIFKGDLIEIEKIQKETNKND